MSLAAVTDTLTHYGQAALAFLQAHVFTLVRLAEIGAIAAAFLLAVLLAPRAQRAIDAVSLRLEGRPKIVQDVMAALKVLVLPGLWLILQWVTLVAANEIGKGSGLLRIAVNLLTAWVLIRFASRLIRHTVWSNLIFFLVWATVALNVLGLLDPLIASLDHAAFTLGNVRISAYTVIKGMIALAIMLWAASLASRFLAERIRHIEDLTPSLQMLLSKLLQFVLVGIAIVLALNIVGIDLTAFTVFSGALGIGIGLGLQKAAGNVVGGLMLLLDKSIKPGDVVSVGDTFGWITSLGGRYVSIRTRDGIEHLIPNEVFISNGVENWSFTDRAIRLRIPIGVSYESDLNLVMKLCIDAANAVPRAVRFPPSECLLMAFGADGLDLELRIWIADPENGVNNVKSEVLLGVWSRFREHGIEIPYPQRDVRVTVADALALSERALAVAGPRGGAPDALKGE